MIYWIACSASCAPYCLPPGQHLPVKTSRPLTASAQTSCGGGSGGAGPTDAVPSVVLTDGPAARRKSYGCADSERSSAPHSPNGGVSEDATPQFHLCVGISVYGRDHGGALPQLHVQLSWRPDLAGAHAPLHARAVRARAADPHLHPPGPQQGQTARSAAAHPAARTHRQVGVLLLLLFISLLGPHTLVAFVLSVSRCERRETSIITHSRRVYW